MKTGVLLRFEFHVPHQILNKYCTQLLSLIRMTSLTKTWKSVDKKWTLFRKLNIFLAIFSKISLIKVGLLVWYSLKIRKFEQIRFIFVIEKWLWKYLHNWHFSSDDFRVFRKRYESDLRVIFHRWPKLCTGFDEEREIQILKGL